jgi:hypothetical protein
MSVTADQAQLLVIALGAIARGRADCGRPLAAETARQLARAAMIECGLQWPQARSAARAPSAERGFVVGAARKKDD